MHPSVGLLQGVSHAGTLGWGERGARPTVKVGWRAGTQGKVRTQGVWREAVRGSREGGGAPSQGGQALPPAPHPDPRPPPRPPLPTPFWGRFGRSGWGGPTWVRREPVIVETVRARLPVGLGGQGAESIDPDGRRETRKRAGAAALRGVGCRWRGVGRVRPQPRPARPAPAAGPAPCAQYLQPARAARLPG